jgi:hypothetical protein
MDDPFVNKIEENFTLQERLPEVEEAVGPEVDGVGSEDEVGGGVSRFLRMLVTFVRLLCRTRYSCSSSAKQKNK